MSPISNSAPLHFNNTAELIDFLTKSKNKIADKTPIKASTAGVYIDVLRRALKAIDPAQHHIIRALYLDIERNTPARKKLLKEFGSKKNSKNRNFAAALKMTERALGFTTLEFKSFAHHASKTHSTKQQNRQNPFRANAAATPLRSAIVQTRREAQVRELMDALLLPQRDSQDFEMTPVDVEWLAQSRNAVIAAEKDPKKFLNGIRTEIWPNYQDPSFKHLATSLTHPLLKALAELIQPREWLQRLQESEARTGSKPSSSPVFTQQTASDFAHTEALANDQLLLDFNAFRGEDLVPAPGDRVFSTASPIENAHSDSTALFPGIFGSVTDETSSSNLPFSSRHNSLPPPLPFDSSLHTAESRSASKDYFSGFNNAFLHDPSELATLGQIVADEETALKNEDLMDRALREVDTFFDEPTLLLTSNIADNGWLSH